MAHSSRQHDHAARSEEQLYFPLPEGRYIRLLELLQGTRSGPLIVRMFVVALSEAPDYDAISYVWGAPGDTMSVLCNGVEIDITKNLGFALQRVRGKDRSRILWADAICIDQTNLLERGHHVGFMGEIYGQAKTVLVNLGPDPDGGARDVVALVKESAERVAQYGSVEKMPVLSQDDPLFDDPRWKAMAAMTNCVWFTRTWVIQEVGLASNPRALFGESEFSYKDLMTLAAWHVRCAPYLTPRQNVEFTTIHVEWLDWKLKGQGASETQDHTFLDLLNHARWLACMDPRDHVYAFLGHPLARSGTGDDDETIVKPDYSKPFKAIYHELAIQVLSRDKGLRMLSTVEHDDRTINDEYPSWVTSWNVEQTMCTLGIFSGSYYNACKGLESSHSLGSGSRFLEVKAVFFDVVSKVFQFSALDLIEPAKLVKKHPEHVKTGAVANIWSEFTGNISSPSQTAEARLDALGFTLTAGQLGPNPAEEHSRQHRRNFAAYSTLAPGTQFIGSFPQFMDLAPKGDPYRYWLDIRQVCEGRSFCFTTKSHLALGPLVTEPDDLVCVLFGAKVPFILRRTQVPGRYKLVGEAYIHGFMRGEVIDSLSNGEYQEETIILC